MSEIQWGQPVFKYSACEPFTKNKKEYNHLKKQGAEDVFIKKN